MQPLEREVRLIVTEGGRIQARDIRVTTLMFGMAVRAFPGLDTRDAPMKSLPCLDVLIDLLVTIQAQAGLMTFLETAMTLLALFLVLGVPLDQLPGHEQGLEVQCLGGPKPQQRERCEYD